MQYVMYSYSSRPARTRKLTAKAELTYNKWWHILIVQVQDFKLVEYDKNARTDLYPRIFCIYDYDEFI